MKTFKAILGFILAIALLVGAGMFYFHFYFVFGEGVKAGELNRVVYKGIVWKTYEGRAIQSGFSSNKGSANGGVQSNEFVFSVKDKAIAEKLMYECSGMFVQLHYKEYRGALPWRGEEKFIVDSIVSVSPIQNPQSVIPIMTE
ncbi:MAG: hypothetical protein MJY56_07110 [Bacteroidales bacterium]|nr:hypothetical protein [Bacteroidales bacterium]